MNESPGTRERLLQEAVSAIVHGGEAAVRIRDIAKAAGVSYASVYHFFGSREGLIEAAQAYRYRSGVSQMIEAFAQASAKATTKDEFIQSFKFVLGLVFSSERSSIRMSRINVLGSAEARPSLLAVLANTHLELFNELAESFKKPQAMGWVRADLDLVAVSAWLNGQLTGRLLAEITHGGVDLKAWDAIARDAIMAILLTDTSG